MRNIWFTGVPGSRWSGVHRLLINACDDIDRTDETPDRRFYHKNADPHNPMNGHSGAYWGPGMGCGEHWQELTKLGKERIQLDIDSVFHGEGRRVIKNHYLNRHYNLDYIWENFPSDELFLVYRESQKSFAWWCEVMDFTEDHWPDYRPGYKNYDYMHNCIRYENAYMLDFAMRKGLTWRCGNSINAFKDFPGFDPDKYYSKNRWGDLYVAYTRIPIYEHKRD